jgi:HEAT repeat protein
MALFRNGKPNVKALSRRGDADALVAAVGYQDLMPARGGGMLDRGVEVRQEAILGLGRMGPDVGAEAVTAALSDPFDHVRLAAIRVLYARQEAMPLAAALAWLPRNRGHSRRMAMSALAKLRRSDSAPALAAALVHARGDDPIDEDEGLQLILLLEADEGSDAACEVVEQLLVALADERDAVADRAEDLLALLAPVSIEGLIAELKAGAAAHRAAAVLAGIKDTRALAPLMEALLHRDARVRAESATALGELRDPAAVEALIHATRDADHRVRARAGYALDQLGMIAMVVGVATLVRPMILEAVAGAESRPALPEAEQAPRATNGATPNHASEATNGASPGQPHETTNGTAPHEMPEQPTADLLERLFPGPDEGSAIEGGRS